MKSIILKIVIVAAILGLIIVGVIIYFNNKDIEKRTYNIIINKSEEVDFEQVTNHANSVKNSNDAQNEYAAFTIKNITNLNEFIDYYLVYIPMLEDISTKDKKELVNLYEEYIDLVIKSEADYVTYQETYKGGSEPAINGLSAYYAMSLNAAYKKGNAFLTKLIAVVNENAYDNYEQKNLYTIMVDILKIFGNKMAISVDSMMSKQYEDQSLSGAPSITTIGDYNNYIALEQFFKNNINDSKEMNDTNLSAFVKNYNAIVSAVDFFENPTQYMQKLQAESQELLSCRAVIDFLNSTANTNL